ncbi:hypothetical protein Zm00014a_019607 [Zea mays]|uniref:Uncharacterized protein n=1 Tax=Zea mays TaxID=4577 RepID=A0A3L6EL51_MAIZE|nr:hypothetical protein Zm00014a_019607 [Zea mays]
MQVLLRVTYRQYCCIKTKPNKRFSRYVDL